MQAEVSNRNTYPINSVTNINTRELFQHPEKRGIFSYSCFFVLLVLAFIRTLINLTSPLSVHRYMQREYPILCILKDF